MRPARDSGTPFIMWNCCEPVSKNIPLAFPGEVMQASSTRVFMYRSSSGTFCISSKITGTEVFARNRRGFSLACFWTSMGLRERYLRSNSTILRKEVLLAYLARHDQQCDGKEGIPPPQKAFFILRSTNIKPPTIQNQILNCREIELYILFLSF